MIRPSTLIDKILPSWRGLFGVLCSLQNPQQEALCWLNEKRSSQYGTNLNWGDLFIQLLEEEPKIESDNSLVL